MIITKFHKNNYSLYSRFSFFLKLQISNFIIKGLYYNKSNILWLKTRWQLANESLGRTGGASARKL